MLIPAVEAQVLGQQLDEPHAPFDQPAGHQALPAKDIGRRFANSIQGLRRLRLARQVGQFRNGGLHPRGQLVVPNRRLERIG